MIGLPRGKVFWILISLLGLSSCGFIFLILSTLLVNGDVSEPPSSLTMYVTVGIFLVLTGVFLGKGIGKTFFDVWEPPSSKIKDLMGSHRCVTCSRQGQPGQVYSGSDPYGKLMEKRAFICNDCVRLRYQDTRLFWIFIILVGLLLSQYLFNPMPARHVALIGSFGIWITDGWLVPVASRLFGLGAAIMAIFGVYRLFKPFNESELPETGIAVVSLLHEDRLD